MGTSDLTDLAVTRIIQEAVRGALLGEVKERVMGIEALQPLAVNCVVPKGDLHAEVTVTLSGTARHSVLCALRAPARSDPKWHVEIPPGHSAPDFTVVRDPR